MMHRRTVLEIQIQLKVQEIKIKALVILKKLQEMLMTNKYIKET